MSGSDENSISPDINIRTSPPSVHQAVSREICAGVSCRIPHPRSRKSTSEMVPTEKANPTIWKHSRMGNASSEELSGFSINMVQVKLKLYHDQTVHCDQTNAFRPSPTAS